MWTGTVVRRPPGLVVGQREVVVVVPGVVLVIAQDREQRGLAHQRRQRIEELRPPLLPDTAVGDEVPAVEDEIGLETGEHLHDPTVHLGVGARVTVDGEAHAGALGRRRRAEAKGAQLRAFPRHGVAVLRARLEPAQPQLVDSRRRHLGHCLIQVAGVPPEPDHSGAGAVGLPHDRHRALGDVLQVRPDHQHRWPLRRRLG